MSSSLPDLSSLYPVTSAQKAEYQERGYVLLREVCTFDEIEAHAAVIRDTALTHSRETRPMEERDTYGKAFLQIINLWQKNPEAAVFATAQRFGQIAADLMGVDGVRLYHDQALFKEPFGGPTPWHQDQFYWPLDGVKCVTMWMPMVRIEPDMMAMKFVPGTHLDGPITMKEISDDSEGFFNDFIHSNKLPIHQVQEMMPGDATFHDGWTLHGAPGNATDRMREVMTLIFFADGGKISTPTNSFREADMAGFFPGQQPGELAASPLNPLVYSRR